MWSLNCCTLSQIKWKYKYKLHGWGFRERKGEKKTSAGDTEKISKRKTKMQKNKKT